MIELRQSTARIIPVGSAMAVGDGFTPVTGLALGAADQAEILKANGAATVDISGYTFAAITGADGWYHLTVTASGSDTLGEMKVVIQDESLILPIEETCMVVTQNYWDSKYGTDKLEVDAVTIAAAAVDSIWANVLEGTLTAEQMMRIILAAVAGKTTGGGIVFRDVADAKDRITATVDGSGNRTAITLDGT